MSAEEHARLAHMAGQIAAAFRSLPDDEAAAAVAAHINQFWPVMMRRDFVARFAGDPMALDRLVARALPRIAVPAPNRDGGA
jgi:formate dehydrogenase subunit delta